MSKRKSRTKSMVVDKSDMVFEDDSSNPDLDELVLPQQTKSLTEIAKGGNKASGSRVSARGKREKKIYDPSDHYGPVHKKKKEAEAQVTAAKKTPQKLQVTKTPVKTPAKVDPVPIKTTKPPATPQSAKRKLDLSAEASESPLEKVQKVIPIPPTVKETSKRIQARKEKSVEKAPTEVPKPTPPPLLIPPKSILRQSVSSERSVQTSSTAPARDSNVTDISKWTPNEVTAYFIREGFDKKDAAKFKEEEIDGETLLILQRDDLKNLNLKVGVFVKMWNHILRFQSGNIK